jgi:excisionase family DNA binding protein
MPKITKERAAELLGKSLRAVERYSKSSEGRPALLSVTYEKGTTRDVPVYDEWEVAQLAERLKLPSVPARGVLEVPQTAIATRNDTSDNLVAILERMASAMEATRRAIPPGEPSAPPSVPIADKPLLKLAEAAALTGLSRGILREAIDAGKLKARIIGRGWRVKRDELDAYVKKL